MDEGEGGRREYGDVAEREGEEGGGEAEGRQQEKASGAEAAVVRGREDEACEEGEGK